MQTSAAEVTTDELALLPDAIQPERDFSDPANFINRELSWLEFNRRVLEEAQDPTQPLIERVKFMTIFSNNLDEFFEIRVAGNQLNAVFRVPFGAIDDDLVEGLLARQHRRPQAASRPWVQLPERGRGYSVTDFKRRLEHGPEKWDPVFGQDHAQGTRIVP